ncbi:MAG: hypothetical protein FWC90_03775 [Oscillospiraceae bacterium]|nr:hypothetical protein [Oscillospiraceae bacterium]
MKENIPKDPPNNEADFKTLYLGLFNGISLIIENTFTYEQSIEALKQLQSKVEDYYVSFDE